MQGDTDWEKETIPRAVLRAAERYGEHAALEDGDVRFSFAALAAEGLRATRAFVAAGVEPGDRVAIWAPNIAEWVVAAIGLQSAGAALVPLSTRFKAAEAGYVLRKSGARLLCTVGEFLGVHYPALLEGEELPALREIVTLRGSAARTTSWSDFLARGERVPASHARERALAVSPDDLSDVMFTSGTTGNPKGVMTSHGQNLRVFDVWSRGAGIREGDRYLIVNPFFHTFGYKAGWLACIQVGATAIPHAVFDAEAVLERIGKDRISVLPGPPTLYQSLLAHPGRAKLDLSSLRVAVTGAAPVPVELVRRMREELGFEIVITAYGLTECSGTVTMCLPSDDAETISTTSGRPLPGVEVRCVDGAGKELPAGTPGEIEVRGFNVMRGYLDDPEETARTVDSEGWLHTGDVGVLDARGYLRITDRIKDMYIAGGFNCYPAEIENLIYGHGGISQVAVVGIPDERMGEVGMAWVVPAPGAAIAADELIAWCRAHMSNYKVPRRVEIVASLPTNAAGKILKYELRRRVAAPA